MFLKSSTWAIKTVRNIEDLRAIGETMKLTYKAITMENEDTDFQFYDRLLTRTTDKILQGTEGRSVRHLHIDFLMHQINKLYNTEWAKLYKSEKYLNTPIEDFYTINAATLNFNPTDWLDLYNHSDPKTIPAQKGTERPDRQAARDDDRPPRNGKRDYPDRNIYPQPPGYRPQQETVSRRELTKAPKTRRPPATSRTSTTAPEPRNLSRPRTYAFATFSIKRTRSPSSSRVLASPARAIITRISATASWTRPTRKPCARTCNSWKVSSQH